MTAREAHQAQWKALQDKPLSDKLKYIVTYYWPAILGVICVIAIAISWIGSALSQKEAFLSGYMINGTTNPSYTGNLKQEFMALQQVDTNKYDFILSTDVVYNETLSAEGAISVMESLVVQAAAGELDFIVADLDSYPVFSAYYRDLTTVLTAEQIANWQDLFVYAEKEALEFLTSDDLFEFEIPKFYTSKEGMKEPVALGIRLPATCRLLEAYAFPAGDVIFGISYNTENIENTLAFLEYIMN